MAMKQSDALEKLAATPREYLTPAEVAPVIGADPQYVRLAARSRPELLGFPVICIGSRVKIPKEPFLRLFGFYQQKERGGT